MRPTGLVHGAAGDERAADAAEFVHDGEGVVGAGELARRICSPNIARLSVYIAIVARPQTTSITHFNGSSDIVSGRRTGLGATTKQVTSGLSNPMHAGVGAADYTVVGARASARAVRQRLDANPDEMRQRRETVEHPIGTTKARVGATHFLTKTFPKVAAEMALSWPKSDTGHEHRRYQAVDWVVTCRNRAETEHALA
jgi:hypothetical protein